jgi:hypothetical protein
MQKYKTYKSELDPQDYMDGDEVDVYLAADVDALLKEVDEVLSHYVFSYDGDDEWNNDDVIEMREKLRLLMERST